ncbi:MAG: hypothetical protein HY226_04260 [Candidatus Vogelbacteria bacterium]|nr:hypothetical protein [Candidatus Vogelbacteria bacterium]
MNIKDWFQKINSKIVLYVLAALIVALIIFRAGMSVGYRQASFSYRFGERYYQSFGRMRNSPMMGLRNLREEFGTTYGTSGKIVKITLPKIIIEDQDNIEKVIAIDDSTTTKTILRSQRDAIKPSDLKVGDNIVVLGSPDENSEIDAKLIRVVPELSATSSSQTK